MPGVELQGKGATGREGKQNRAQRKRGKRAQSDSEDEAEEEVVHVHPKSEELARRILDTLSKKVRILRMSHRAHTMHGAICHTCSICQYPGPWAMAASSAGHAPKRAPANCVDASWQAPFEGHDDSDLVQLVAAMAPVEVKAGVDVIKEGDTGDLAYWVDSGELAVIVDGDKEVDTITSDTVFGEVQGNCTASRSPMLLFHPCLPDEVICASRTAGCAGL